MGIPKSQQWDLFNGKPPKSHHATRLTPDAKINWSVNNALAPYGLLGAMAEEIGDAIGLTQTQVQSALGELHKLGYVRDTEVKRLSRTGGWCTVYIATGKKVSS